MSNKPHNRPSHYGHLQPVIGPNLMGDILHSQAGQEAVRRLNDLKAFCDEKDLDFDRVTELFQVFAARSQRDLPGTIAAFCEWIKLAEADQVPAFLERVKKDPELETPKTDDDA